MVGSATCKRNLIINIPGLLRCVELRFNGLNQNFRNRDFPNFYFPIRAMFRGFPVSRTYSRVRALCDGAEHRGRDEQFEASLSVGGRGGQ